jgi:drug/metabolite transporter (DMT)-like permease
VLAAAATGIQVGAAMVATRFVVDEAGPATLALFRYGIGFLCLLPFVIARGEAPRFERRDIAPIALLGILQFGVLIALLNYGLEFIPSGRAALIFATFPLLTMLIAAALGHERLGWAKSAGVLMTILGVGLALGEKALARGGAESWIGELAVLASAFSGALCTVLYRPYLRKYPTLPVSASAMLASVAFLALLAAGEGLFTEGPRFTALGWGAVLFIGVSSGVFYFVWLWALTHAPATEVTVVLALSPVAAALLGAALLGEKLTPLMAAGLAAVALGLVLAHRQPRAHEAPGRGGATASPP